MKTTYLERMQLLDEVDEFSEYFTKLFTLLHNDHDFDEKEYNKFVIILYKMVNDIKS